MTETRLRWICLSVMVCALGCHGNIVGGGPKTGPDETSATQENKDEICSEESGRIPARRLTHEEYNNTVRHLFGPDAGRPADAFPDDALTANGLTVSDLYLEKTLEASGNLAALAVQSGIIKCDPTKIDPKVCARQTLEPFLKKAWRRPVSAAEIDRAVSFLEVAKAQRAETSPFTAGIRLAIQDAIMAPSFIYRFEQVADPNSSATQPLGPYEIANRLSYFIYASMPDDALFAAAESGRLSDPAEIEAQVMRMLSDPKSDALIERLVGRWLSLDHLAQLNPDHAVYPKFDEALRSSMRQETKLFVKEFLLQDNSVRDMMDANFTYLNRRLATHYGLAEASTLGDSFSRVTLSDSRRGGLLTQAAVLASSTVASNDPTAPVAETGIIFRGRFVLRNLLGANLKPPPPDLDVNAIQAEAQQDIPLSEPRKVREGVRLSRMPCLNCHTRMDPLGYSMEHYDVLGVWRERDLAGTQVDSTGNLLDDADQVVGAFDGARSMAKLLKNDARMTRAFTEALLQNALGRPLEKQDKCRAKKLAQKVDAQGGQLRRFLISIVQDTSFTHLQGEAL